MERLILNSYLEIKGRKEQKISDVMKEMSMFRRIAFYALLVSGITSIIIILFFPVKIKFAYVGILIETICLIIMKSQERIDIKNHKIRIREKDEEYVEMLRWLKEIKYSEKNQIKQLCFRCEKFIEEERREKEKFEKVMDKIFTVCLAPVFLAVINWTFNLDGKANEHLMMVFFLTMVVIAVYMIFIGVTKGLQEIIYSTQQSMQYMVEDLHGVLDRCFEIEDNDII